MIRSRKNPSDVYYTRCPVPTALAVALETGMLEEEFAAGGIRIRSLSSSPTAAIRDSHYTHGHPRLIRQGGNMPPLMAFDRGHDLRIVALSWTEVSLPMLTLRGTGLESPADLRGRRLPLPRRPDVSLDCWEPAILRGYERTLASAGLRLDDVELVPIEVDRTFTTTRFTHLGGRAPLWDREFILGLQREEILALLMGEVDAIFSESSIAATVAPMFGLSPLVDLRFLPDPLAKVTLPLPLTISVSGRLLDDDPTLVARWLAVLMSASDRARMRPEEARRILAAEVSIPTDALDDAMDPEAQRHLDIGLEDEWIEALESQAAFLFDHGYTKRMVDPESIIDPGPLRMAREIADPEPTREAALPG